MKRYRVFSLDFDARPGILVIEIKKEWDPVTQKLHEGNKSQVIDGLKGEFGSERISQKIQNFIDLGNKPFSVLSFHNDFYEQVRRSFIMGSYYPALTGACGLGERILNHLLISLRENYTGTPEYKKIHLKCSFDKWEDAINILQRWGVLLPNVAEKFLILEKKRNHAIHFNPEIDTNDREYALAAINCLNDIISDQFSAFGNQPWFITTVPGEIYIKKEWESKPFIREIYLPNCLLVGPFHKITSMIPQTLVTDTSDYPSEEISDEEFVRLRTERGKS